MPHQLNTTKIELPHTSGSVKSVSESFHADAFSGTVNYNIPIPIPASRALAPSLSVSYGSSSGNGLLGIGTQLTEDAISIKTNRALPKYDASDRYTWNGIELVEQTRHDNNIEFLERHQSSFAKIEKLGSGKDVYWKITHNDNSVSIYGGTPESKIFNPDNPEHIFKWLIASTEDAEGNRIIYQYNKFNGTNAYLTAVKYGKYFLQEEEGLGDHFAYKIRLDYGQLKFKIENSRFSLDEDLSEPDLRKDVLSDYRPGFLVKTEFLLKNVFTFHNFIDDPKTGGACLTERVSFRYDVPDFTTNEGVTNPVSMLKSVVNYGFIKQEKDSYSFKQLPAVDLDFSRFPSEINKLSFTPIKNSEDEIINQPLNLVDFHSEGIAGVLYRNAETLYYDEPLGGGIYRQHEQAITAPNGFANPDLPMNLVSLDGNGKLQIELNESQKSGYYPMDTNDTWREFIPFENEFLNTIPYRTEKVDVSGDSRMDDLVITSDTVYFLPSLGTKGMSSELSIIENTAEVEAINNGAISPFIYYGFADVFGDGLQHRIKVEELQITIWPNLGYGKFGKKEVLRVPDLTIDSDVDLNDQLLLADVNGSGTTDLVLIHSEKIQVFFNQSGNGFSAPVEYSFGNGLTWTRFDRVLFQDVVGNGKPCIILSKNSPHVYNDQFCDTAHYYFEFSHSEGNEQRAELSNKAFLLSATNNNMGVENQLFYKSSLKDYLADQRSENPWITQLPFPVMVLDRSIVTDHISETTYSEQYHYRNGYYDPNEYMFTGFGMVQHISTPKEIDNAPTASPLLTKQWFHLGNGTDEEATKKEFYQGDKDAPVLPFQHIPESCKDKAQALYALVGAELHSEVYEAENRDCPYTVSGSCYEVVEVQDPSSQKEGVYRIFSREEIDLNYEQRSDDPHVSHSCTLETDAFNHVLKSCSLVYPRRTPLIPEQNEMHCTASEVKLKNQDAPDKPRMIGVELEAKGYEILGLIPPQKMYFAYEELKNQLIDEGAFVNPIAYSEQADESVTQSRLLSWGKSFYWNNEMQETVWDASTEIPAILLPHHSASIVFDAENSTTILGDKVQEEDLEKAGFVFDTETNYWWAKSAVSHFLKTKESFYALSKESYDWAEKSDYLYTESVVEYDPYYFFPVISKHRLNDSTYLATKAEIDYRTLSPWKVEDANGNHSEVLTDELGMVIATATYEKNGTDDDQGDAPLEQFTPKTIEDLNDLLEDNPLDYIQQAGSFVYYEFAHFDTAKQQWNPAFSASLTRTTYKPESSEEIQRGVAYSDGFGRIIETKAFAGTGEMTFDRSVEENRWLASGRVLYNGKGEVSKSYLGYFTDSWEYKRDWEDTVQQELPNPTTFIYDAPGRLIQTNTPKGFFTRSLVLNAWSTQHFDENDTLLESPYYQSKVWENIPEETDAIEKASLFYNTPSTETMDPLGRQIIAVSDNHSGRTPEDQPIDWNKKRLTSDEINPNDPDLLVTWQSFDIQGRVLKQADARFNAENQTETEAEKKYNFVHFYPIAGGMSRTWSSDAGLSFGYSDVHGNAITGWDALGSAHTISYDNLQRPIAQSTKTPEGYTPKVDQTIAVTVYGETVQDAQQKNMLGQVYQQFGSAGFSEIPAYAFDGTPTESNFQYNDDYKNEANWNAIDATAKEQRLEPEVFQSKASVDAIGRPVNQILPDQSVIAWKYGMMGNCIESSIDVQGAGNPQIIVAGSTLNANGQLTKINYGSGAQTLKNYDPLTLEIAGIKTQTSKESSLQDLSYWHDPTGLITTMQNNLAEVVFNDNAQVDPNHQYTYDAIYRLKASSGRALLSNGNGSGLKKNAEHIPLKKYGAGNLKAVGTYSEQFQYDKSNNVTQVKRTGVTPFTRNFNISQASNRVENYTQGDTSTALSYNSAGFMLFTNGKGSTPLQWNTQGNIASATLVSREGDTPNDTEYYVYAGGIRVRKVVERYDGAGALLNKTDKRYLGDYRRTDTNRGSSGGEMRHSITVSGVDKHDCVVQYTSSENLKANEIIYRFQHGNHLNSIGLETNLQEEIISYEEYSAFGDTVYNYNPKNLDSTKEYRYSAQEKDENTGLYYYGYRYYSPALSCWTRPDPAGTIDGFNLYAFVGNEPVGRIDVMGLGRIDQAEKKGGVLSKFKEGKPKLPSSRLSRRAYADHYEAMISYLGKGLKAESAVRKALVKKIKEDKSPNPDRSLFELPNHDWKGSIRQLDSQKKAIKEEKEFYKSERKLAEDYPYLPTRVGRDDSSYLLSVFKPGSYGNSRGLFLANLIPEIGEYTPSYLREKGQASVEVDHSPHNGSQEKQRTSLQFLRVAIPLPRDVHRRHPTTHGPDSDNYSKEFVDEQNARVAGGNYAEALEKHLMATFSYEVMGATKPETVAAIKKHTIKALKYAADKKIHKAINRSLYPGHKAGDPLITTNQRNEILDALHKQYRGFK